MGHKMPEARPTPVDLTKFYPQFSMAERDRRWSAVRLLMAMEGLDALIVMSNDASFGMATANMRYLTQVGSLCGGEVLFTMDAPPVVWNGNQPQMHEPTNPYMHTQNWVTDIRRSLGLVGLATEIRDRGLDRMRIGIAPFSSTLFRMPYIFAQQQQALKELLPNATLVQASGILERARLVKSDEEVEMVRRAGRLARKAISEMVKSSVAGATEAEIFANMSRTQIAGGGEPQAFNFLSSGPIDHPGAELWRLRHGSEPPASPSLRPVSNGDLVITEFHTAVGGYLAGAEFTVLVGDKIPDQLKRIWDVSVEVLEASAKALRSGNTVREAVAAIRKPVTDAQLSYTELGFHGHGLASPEFPTVVHPEKSDLSSMNGAGIGDIVLERNMVFGNNIDVYDPNWKFDVGCMYGDTMVVRDDGGEKLVDVPLTLGGTT